MRFSLIRGVVWLSIGYLALVDTTQAAVLTGRVADSAGQPVAGAEVRIWQKLPAREGASVTDQAVTLDDADMLVTDSEGKFTSPDVLVGEAFARVVVEATGMLAGRSGWIEVGNDASTTAPDILLKRLRTIPGKVIDRQGRPIVGVTVFNSGDGHERVQTISGKEGVFKLVGVPEGDVFLFAEKAGYRFAGMHLTLGQSEVALAVSTVGEAIEPLSTLRPLLSDAEENALIRDLIDPWLADLARSGSEREKAGALVGLVDFDPLEAFDRFREFSLAEARGRDLVQSLMVERCIARRGALSWDELQTLIESSENHLSMTYQYVESTRQMEAAEKMRRRDWLVQARLHARQIKEPAERTWALALVVDGLFRAGDREQAELIAHEAETLADQLPLDGRQSRIAFRFLALALAHTSANRALSYVEKINDDYSYQVAGGELAVKLACGDADAAEEMWRKTIERDRSRKYSRFACDRYTHIANLCYAWAPVDRARAARIAETAENQSLHVRARGAAALALAQTSPAEARQLLETVVREELAKPTVEDGSGFEFLAPPASAAWLLPIAEKVEPELVNECLWRSLSMRLPRPRRDHLDDGDIKADLATAKMLARYDRELARTILEPIAARLPELARPALTERDSIEVGVGASQAADLARQIVAAAVHVDPRWAVRLLDRLPRGTGPATRRLRSDVLEALVSALGQHGAARWKECDAFCAGFWQPNREVVGLVVEKLK